MKLRYYGGDNAIKFKDPSSNHIVNFIISAIRTKEKIAHKADAIYQKEKSIGW